MSSFVLRAAQPAKADGDDDGVAVKEPKPKAPLSQLCEALHKQRVSEPSVDFRWLGSLSLWRGANYKRRSTGPAKILLQEILCILTEKFNM